MSDPLINELNEWADGYFANITRSRFLRDLADANPQTDRFNANVNDWDIVEMFSTSPDQLTVILSRSTAANRTEYKLAA